MLFQYLSGGLLMIMLGMYAWMNDTISDLEFDNSKLEKDLVEAKQRNDIKDINIRDMNKSIHTQNSMIESIKIDYDKKMIEYQNREPDIIYKTVLEVVNKDINVTRGSCEDTKNVIDAISTIDFNGL